MNLNDMHVYGGYPGPGLLARALLADRERGRREREAAENRQLLELGEIVLHQPNDFAD